MKQILFFASLLTFSFFITSCGDDDDSTTVDYDYHAHIHTPSADDKNVGDTLLIDIVFESHTGEPVHHINIRIHNDSDTTDVYNKPDVAHIHETDGKYEYTDSFILSNTNGVMEHSDWILEAKVWGEEGTEGQVIETVEFHVHP